MPQSRGNAATDRVVGLSEWEVFPPLMGFGFEKYVPGHPDNNTDTDWAAFYTCTANGRRVYVWAYRTYRNGDSKCCVMLDDHVYDPAYHATETELQNMFTDQHLRNAGIRRPYMVPTNPIVLQAFIHELTLKGKYP